MSDSLSFEEECKIRNDKIVNGYIRTHVYRNDNAPKDVIDLVLKYYHVLPERFDINNVDTKNIMISNNGLTATKISRTTTSTL